jgi:uncharacterized membrane protein required for colicin V production
LDALPEISLGTAAVIIFAFCAVCMFLRGIARTIVNAAYITFSAWIGFRVWQQAPSLAIDWFGKPSELVATGLPLAAFLATLLVLRKVIRFFRAPIPRSGEDVAPHSSGQFAFRLLITLVPAALLCLIAATFVHHASSVAEIRDSAKAGSAVSTDPSVAGRLKRSLSLAVPEKLMDWLDPLATEPRLRLAKMIAASSEPLEAVINPETGKPYPRAIIVDNPELLDLAREGRFSTLLRHPLLSEALKDPLIRQALGL